MVGRKGEHYPQVTSLELSTLRQSDGRNVIMSFSVVYT